MLRMRAYLKGLVRRRRIDAEVDEELQFHVEMETQENIARGMAPAEARRVALRDLGGVTQAREAVREMRTLWLDSTWQDLAYACRSLRRRPAMSVAAVAMLALGIGITTAMFTVVDALILRPVPFPKPDELAFIYMGNEHGGHAYVALAVFRAWQRSSAFTRAESARSDTALISVDGLAFTGAIASVTPGIFNLLGGVRPIRGRLFDASDVRTGIDDRVLLSEDLWKRLYHADPAIIGRTVSIDRKPLVVVGILPSEFRFPSWNTAIWRAVGFDALPASAANRRPITYVRFASNVPRPDAVRIATEEARAADPSTAKLWVRVHPLAGQFLDSYYERAVPLLAGGVVLVFLVLCANVSSLLLARLTARQREFSMRSALGASRGRLIRQAFAESCVLGALGVVAGIAVGWTLVSLSRAFLPEAFLLRTLNPLNIDGRALAVTSVSGVVATLVAGLLPAWIGTRLDPDRSLRVAERGGTETRGARAATHALLVGEIALACTLLVCATLLVRSFINLANAERGLDTKGVLVATIEFSTPGLRDQRSRQAARSIEEQIGHLPGVRDTAWSYGVPPGGGATSFGKWRSDAPGSPLVDMVVDRYFVGREFFALYGIPLLRGRLFEPADQPGAVIIGERLARVLWPGLDPIGRTFSFEAAKGEFHVVGLVREIHFPSLNARLDRPQFYEAFDGVLTMGMIGIRCGQACPNTALVRQRILATQPAVEVLGVHPLDDAYFEQLARPRAAAALGFSYAAIALLAAAGGLFSVLSYAVGRRKREFGIRTALGASPGQIRWLVLRDGIVVTLTGMAIGTASAWLLARAVAGLQYGITITDPVTWAGVLGLLAFTTVAASWRPARQAMHADPMLLLREE
jgi:predicted permease